MDFYSVIWFITPIMLIGGVILWITTKLLEGNFKEDDEKMVKRLRWMTFIYKWLFCIGIAFAILVRGPGPSIFSSLTH